MNYINQFQLIQATLDHKSGYLDYKELLSTVDRGQIMKSIEKSNPELKGIDVFFITEDSIEEENWSKLSKKEKRKISRLNEKIKKSEDLKIVIEALESYKQIYPDVPAIYNYLGIAYDRDNQLRKYLRILYETRDKFPDYLHGKISLAEHYLSINRFRKIPDLHEKEIEGMVKYGQTWWGAKWLNALSHIDYSNRLPRGRSYANKGAVKYFQIQGRKIIASVQGTRIKPYKVTVGIPAFTPMEMESLTGTILNNPLLLSKLLNRELPESLHSMAEANHIQIFPGRWNDLEMDCSCPDWAVPCKHLAAVINVIANEIDRNPFLIFKLHGYDIIHKLQRIGIEAISETVTIPDLASLAVAEPAEGYQTDKTIALEEIDFSVLEDMREKLLSLLSEKPVFYSKDFKLVLDKLYRKIARRISRENMMTAGISRIPDHRASHYERYSGVAVTLDECSRLVDCRIRGEPGGSWRVNHKVDKEGTWGIRDDFEMLMFISSIEPRQVSRLLPGLSYLYMVYHFSRKLAETSSLIPQLLSTTEGSYSVRWIPALMDQKVSEIFNSMAAAFPSEKELWVGVGSFPGSSGTKPEQLRSLVSYFIGQFIRDAGSAKQMMGDHVYRIFVEKVAYRFDLPGEREIPSSIQRWIDRFYLTHQAFSPVLEIFEKEDSGRFGLKVLVEDSRQPLKEAVPLADVMTLPEYDDSRYEVLRSVELLTPSLPDLEFIISTSGRHIPVYTPVEFADVMFRILPVIRLYGIRVLLPDQLKNLVRPAVSVALSSSGQVRKRSLLNLEKILNFQWKIALGDTLIDAREFFSMVQGLSGIVKMRDHYLYLNTADLKTLMEQIQQQEGNCFRLRLQVNCMERK